MSTDMKITAAILGTVFAIVLVIATYSLFSDEKKRQEADKNRALYEQCLKITETAIANDRVTTPFCHL
mgnify:CR=1 FL=1